MYESNLFFKASLECNNRVYVYSRSAKLLKDKTFTVHFIAEKHLHWPQSLKLEFLHTK
jgi:hypothetical protein